MERESQSKVKEKIIELKQKIRPKQTNKQKTELSDPDFKKYLEELQRKYFIVIIDKALKFSQFPADLVTFTEEIVNGELHLSCSAISRRFSKYKYKFNINIFTNTKF